MSRAPSVTRTPRGRSIFLLVIAEICGMSLWFVSAAILPEMTAETNLSPMRAGLLATAVQMGFVVGAVTLAIHGTADRFTPTIVFSVFAAIAAAANLALIALPPGGNAQILLRGLTGFCLAGVYPVGMKIAVGWTDKRRGLFVGLLVGALTLGSAAPHGIALIGGADWRMTVAIASLLAFAGAGMILLVKTGPHHASAPRFNPGALALAWTSRPVRLAFTGYLCHMWELYAFWAWIGTALAISLESADLPGATTLSRVATFAAIGLGGLICVPAGAFADRFGKARIAGLSMALSGTAAIATALCFGAHPALTLSVAILWGMFVIPDSALFSALVADAAPPSLAGSLMTFQTALGFLLTTITIQGAPLAAEAIGWPGTLALFGIGPLLGVEAMRRLHELHCAEQTQLSKEEKSV